MVIHKLFSLKIFLALIAAKMIFCSCRFENDFLLLLLWKLFLGPVALKMFVAYLSLHLLLTVGKDFATKFHLSIPQTLRFNNFNFCGKLNLKCDGKSSNISSLFLEIPLQAFRIQPCMYGIPELKRFFTSLFTVWKQKE